MIRFPVQLGDLLPMAVQALSILSNANLTLKREIRQQILDIDLDDLLRLLNTCFE
jgi:hypothetical protein